MIFAGEFPILEFDTDKEAKLNPSVFAEEKFRTDKIVITFFPEVIERLIAERSCLRSA